jgi:subtilisin family serine protease
MSAAPTPAAGRGDERAGALSPAPDLGALTARPLHGRTGSGVGIAVIDSGVNPHNPHIARIAGGIAIDRTGALGNDWIDRLGHGTAVTAAIQERAPGAAVHAVRVFHERLATSVHALVRALDWAAEQRLHLVNLSLGTTNEAHAAALACAVERARDAGVIVVAAREHDGRPCFPGCLDGVIGVSVDWTCARDVVLPDEARGASALRASGYPRPIPGVPPERNLKGSSFAVANATGVLACLLENVAGEPVRPAAASLRRCGEPRRR